MTSYVSEQHICNLPAEERPYEKCMKHGPSVLSDAELLAVILRSGTRGENALQLARRLCAVSEEYPGLRGLYHLTFGQLCEIRGIGKVKAIQLQCIAELSVRLSKAQMIRRLCMNSSETIADYYMEELCHLDHEELHMMMLDAKNRLLNETVLTKGTITMSPVSVRDIFRTALLHNAVSIVLLHNHPSGDCCPSPEDIAVTERVAEAGRLMGIPLLDHVIIGDHTFCSLGDHCS